MALDYYAYTGDPTYLHIAFSAADFLTQHFTNRSETGQVVIWPAQVLETYWCNYGKHQSLSITASCHRCFSCMLFPSLFKQLRRMASPTAVLMTRRPSLL
jgi:hypothetical protein